MKDDDYSWALGVGILTVLTLWFLPKALPQSIATDGLSVWVLRGSILAGGIIFVRKLLLRGRSSPQNIVTTNGGSPDTAKTDKPPNFALLEELQILLTDARGKIKNAPQCRLVFLVYEKSWSEKNSLLDHAGVGCREIAAVRGARISKSEEIYVEFGTDWASEPSVWRSLADSFSPRLSRIGAKALPRALLLVKKFPDNYHSDESNPLSKDAASLLSVPNKAHAALGGPIPVYVIFSDLDADPKLQPLFKAYCRNADQRTPLGVTLPMPVVPTDGPWESYQRNRIAKGCSELFGRLADMLTAQVGDEQQLEIRRAAFLFPRELKWLRKPVVDFLIKLTGPATGGPLLRGFYFSGIGQELTWSKGSQHDSAGVSEIGNARRKDILRATWALALDKVQRLLRKQAEARSLHAESPEGILGPPKPLFLEGAFQIVLRDLRNWPRPAVHLPRIWIAGAFILLVVIIGGLLVSFVNNRSLISDAKQLELVTQSLGKAGNVRANMDTLRRLERGRQLLERLRSYRRNGRPFFYGLGFYVGDEIYGDTRRTYFSEFEKFLLGPVRDSMADFLGQLPPDPAKSDLGETSPITFGDVYSTLKAYLMITSRQDKADANFLAPSPSIPPKNKDEENAQKQAEILLRWWTRDQDSEDKGRDDLVRRQFAYFVRELTEDPPYDNVTSGNAVDSARNYLQRFGAVNTVYQRILSQVSSQKPSVRFLVLYPAAKGIIVQTPDVAGAFTKDGWSAVTSQFKESSRFFDTEQWVVEFPRVDPAKALEEMRGTYQHRFIETWIDFLTKTKIIVCQGKVEDTSKRLEILSGNSSPSPLFGAFAVVAENTKVDSTDVTRAFQSIQRVMSNDPAIDEAANTYRTSLFALSDAIIRAPKNDIRSAVSTQLSEAKLSAFRATQAVAPKFSAEEAGQPPSARQSGIVYGELSRLLKGPEVEAEACAPGLAFSGCQEFRKATSGYPFSRSGEAIVPQVDAALSPGTGKLWEFYQDRLAEFVTTDPRGVFIQNPKASKQVRGEFLQFLNWSARMRDAIYPPSDRQISIRVPPTQGIRKVTIAIDGQRQEFDSAHDRLQAFIWKRSPGGVELNVTLDGDVTVPGPDAPGPWGLVKLFDQMTMVQQSESEVSYEWTIREKRTGKPLLKSGAPLKIELTVKGSVLPILDQHQRTGVSCVSQPFQ